MNGPDLLKKHAGRLKTRVGAAYPGSHAVFRGHDLHRDLKDLDWVELYVFGITGRRLTQAQIEMLHAIWVNTSYPDARLWNNRVAGLAGSARSSANLGIVAALALSEATVYGGLAGLRAISFLQTALQRVADGEELEALVLAEARAHRIYGYGRPINSCDERLPWIMELARKLDLDQGPHLQLAFAVERVLLPHYPQLRMNYAALHAALIADMGLSAREYQLLRIPTFLAGMPPCVVEAAEKPPGALFPTPCTGVAYEGLAQRSWRAQLVE
ncbi:citrate/2-methylcitrate synthase [Massilia sp. YIM B04103]|uniref:citrate/2-methylcitrate synthase n=1 Tax=Massilia sp. YIM B04103 TaxID=2963106 RepID=UPI00210B89C3|nr:citrate/2-methylcitrate synthase [Massilia sp. YIM B04103]